MESAAYFGISAAVFGYIETEDKIKEGTLKVDHGTDAMTVVLGKEKGGYARGVGSGVTYKMYFELPRSRQASDERIVLLQSQLDNERREHQEKELLIQNLSNKMSKAEGMVFSVDINPIDSSADKEGGTPLSVTDGKQMLHNKELPKDCYKVSVDKSLVDAACIPDVGNNGFKTVKDAVGGFFAWPKDLVVFDPKATPPSTIQMIGENKTAPKLQSKRKNVYVSRDTMQKQARMKSQNMLLGIGLRKKINGTDVDYLLLMFFQGRILINANFWQPLRAVVAAIDDVVHSSHVFVDVSLLCGQRGYDDKFPSIMNYLLAFIPLLGSHIKRGTAAMSVTCKRVRFLHTHAVQVVVPCFVCAV
ncbi:hypothetical protein Tco_0511681 [Tanacetum coccineum]